jgi:hypothetical protein
MSSPVGAIGNIVGAGLTAYTGLYALNMVGNMFENASERYEDHPKKRHQEHHESGYGAYGFDNDFDDDSKHKSKKGKKHKNGFDYNEDIFDFGDHGF